ncbi:MAG: hypothetical protein ACFCUJ_02465 [Thiotrichales bacterium]
MRSSVIGPNLRTMRRIQMVHGTRTVRQGGRAKNDQKKSGANSIRHRADFFLAPRAKRDPVPSEALKTRHSMPITRMWRAGAGIRRRSHLAFNPSLL